MRPTRARLRLQRFLDRTARRWLRSASLQERLLLFHEAKRVWRTRLLSWRGPRGFLEFLAGRCRESEEDLERCCSRAGPPSDWRPEPPPLLLRRYFPRLLSISRFPRFSTDCVVVVHEELASYALLLLMRGLDDPMRGRMEDERRLSRTLELLPR